MTKVDFASLVRELKGIEGDIWFLVKNNDPNAVMERLRQVRRCLESQLKIRVSPE